MKTRWREGRFGKKDMKKPPLALSPGAVKEHGWQGAKRIGRKRGFNLERVISLLNCKQKKLFNGTQAVVIETSGQNQMTIETRNDDQEVQFLPEIFGMEKYPDFQDLLHRGHPFDYAYCLTCHKAQGSEWDRVAVIDEGHKMPWQTPSELHRWRYTAASQARTGLTWIKSLSA